MKKWVVYFALLFTAAAYAGDQRYVIATVVNLRELPSMDARIVGKLPIATRVEIQQSEWQWVKVVAQNGDRKTQRGWVDSEFIVTELPTIELLLTKFDLTPEDDQQTRLMWAERAMALGPTNVEVVKRFKGDAAASVAKLATSSADKLEELYRLYEVARQDNSEAGIETLIRIDQELRSLIDKPWMIGNKSVDGKYWNERYSDIGVGVGHYSDALEYSGALLREANKRDINKRFEAYTAYADIYGGQGSFSGGFGVPNITAALQYEKKFPTGPFIEDTLIIIGSFYDDLYKALKARDEKDYIYDCFSRHFDETPVSAQIERSRLAGINYYSKVLALHSKSEAANRSVLEWRRDLESGNSRGWHFCSD